MDDIVCRICFGSAYENGLGKLISPCMCSGSMRYVHMQCLNDWRSESSNPRSFTHCDQCGYAYNIQRTQWANILENPRLIRGVSYMLLFISTIMCALVLTPFNATDHFLGFVRWNPRFSLFSSIWCWQIDFIISGLLGISVVGVVISIRDAYYKNRFTNHTWFISLITPFIAGDVRIYRVFVIFGIFAAVKSVFEYSEYMAKILLTKWGMNIIDMANPST